MVALLSTGNEIIDLHTPNPHSGDDWGGVFDTNRPSLQAALEGMGYDVVDLGVVPDRLGTSMFPLPFVDSFSTALHLTSMPSRKVWTRLTSF